MKSTQLVALFLIFLSSCTTKKITDYENGILKFSGCPDGGDCNIEQIRDTQINLERDDNGKLYPELKKSNTYHLYKITYNKQTDKSLADTEYQEIIYFEIEKSKTFRQFNNKALDRAKVTYGRLCRCPEETGYEPIYDGKLYFETFRQVTEIKLEIIPKTLPVIMNNFQVKVAFND